MHDCIEGTSQGAAGGRWRAPRAGRARALRCARACRCVVQAPHAALAPRPMRARPAPLRRARTGVRPRPRGAHAAGRCERRCLRAAPCGGGRGGGLRQQQGVVGHDAAAGGQRERAHQCGAYAAGRAGACRGRHHRACACSRAQPAMLCLAGVLGHTCTTACVAWGDRVALRQWWSPAHATCSHAQIPHRGLQTRRHSLRRASLARQQAAATATPARAARAPASSLAGAAGRVSARWMRLRATGPSAAAATAPQTGTCRQRSRPCCCRLALPPASTAGSAAAVLGAAAARCQCAAACGHLRRRCRSRRCAVLLTVLS